MNKRKVLIITGEDYDNIKNNYYQLDVHPQCAHTFILTDFMLRNKIEYPYKSYRNSHELVKMAILSNVVIFVMNGFHLIALPDEITDYQLEKLDAYENTFKERKYLFCIINIKKDGEKIVFEEIDSTKSQKIYFDLINEKHKKWLSKIENIKVKKISMS